MAVAWLVIAAEWALRWRWRRRLCPANEVNRPITVVALGDSIVAGWPAGAASAWPALLARHLQAEFTGVAWHVINAGVPGDTAPRGYARLDACAAAPGVRIVLVAFGLNDCYPGRYGLDRALENCLPRVLVPSYLWRALYARGQRLCWRVTAKAEPMRLDRPRTSPQGFRRALDALAGRARQSGWQAALLTMPPLSPQPTAETLARSATYDLYNELIRNCAARHRLPLVELATTAPTGAFHADGIHLTQIGQQWVAQQVYEQLKAAGLWADCVRRRQR